MQIQENIPLGPKTTMRIGGVARYYGEIQTQEDCEQTVIFSKEHNIPLILLGGGSNTIFADGTVNALVARMKADAMEVKDNEVRVQSGKILASLINELAAHNLDLSSLTGILGTVGGAVFGNAGQGFTGIWIDSFVKYVTVYLDGQWRTLTKEECDFRYRESLFKNTQNPPIIWDVQLEVPSKPEAEIKEEVQRLLKRRIETQPHVKTAGSCFKTTADGTPAWKLIEAAGLRGKKIGGVEIAEKHANFLLNVEKGTFQDVVELTTEIRKKVPAIENIEMRLYGEDGKIVEI